MISILEIKNTGKIVNLIVSCNQLLKYMSKKLLVLTAHFPPDIGAASIRVSEIIKKLSADDDIGMVKVLILNPELKNVSCTDSWIKVSKQVEVLYKKPILPSAIHRLPIINPLTLLEWLIALWKIRDYHPDLIISTSPPPHPVISACFLSNLSKSKYLVDIRDDWSAYLNELFDSQQFIEKHFLKSLNSFINFIYIFSCKSATIIICVHEVLRNKFQKYQKMPIIVIPNGINDQVLQKIKSDFDRDSVFRKNNIKFNQFTKFLIYTGDLRASYYNPEIILETIKKLVSSGLDIKYILLGDGNQKEKIARLAEIKGIKENVYLLGKKSHQEALELLLASDIAFYPVNKNAVQAKYAFGVKIYEYIACGRPILAIINDDSTLSQIVTQNNIGISLNWDEATKNESLKNALLNILQNYALHSQNISAYYNNNLSKFDRLTGLEVFHNEVSKILK